MLGILSTTDIAAQMQDTQLIWSGVTSDLPHVIANDNRIPAGDLNDAVLEIDLKLVWADWRIETPDGPGLRLWAIAENGRAPTIPAPLVRVESGTRIRATVRNTVPDSTITVYGLHTRPADELIGVPILPGESHEFNFEAGDPGTYFYFFQIGADVLPDIREAEQLAGAFIVDPIGGSPDDRVFVMNIFSTTDSSGYIEALTINGLSFPFTERQTPSVGVTERWRIIDATRRNHSGGRSRTIFMKMTNGVPS